MDSLFEMALSQCFCYLDWYVFLYINHYVPVINVWEKLFIVMMQQSYLNILQKSNSAFPRRPCPWVHLVLILLMCMLNHPPWASLPPISPDSGARPGYAINRLLPTGLCLFLALSPSPSFFRAEVHVTGAVHGPEKATRLSLWKMYCTSVVFLLPACMGLM